VHPVAGAAHPHFDHQKLGGDGDVRRHRDQEPPARTSQGAAETVETPPLAILEPQSRRAGGTRRPERERNGNAGTGDPAQLDPPPRRPIFPQMTAPYVSLFELDVGTKLRPLGSTYGFVSSHRPTK
jgi:hypothetical protein